MLSVSQLLLLPSLWLSDMEGCEGANAATCEPVSQLRQPGEVSPPSAGTICNLTTGQMSSKLTILVSQSQSESYY